MIKNGAEVNAVDLADQTPILMASRGKNKEAIQELMLAKADPYKKTKSGVCVCDICEGIMGDLSSKYKQVYYY